MLTTKPPMASATPNKARARLMLTAEDGVNCPGGFTFEAHSFSADVRSFLEKLFVEKDQRPAAEDMRQDPWVNTTNLNQSSN